MLPLLLLLLLLFSATAPLVQKACCSFRLSGDHAAGRGSGNGVVNTIFDPRGSPSPGGILTGMVCMVIIIFFSFFAGLIIYRLLFSVDNNNNRRVNVLGDDGEERTHTLEPHKYRWRGTCRLGDSRLERETCFPFSSAGS